MARPIDPTSVASRIRQSFLDGRPFVAYEAPADLAPNLIAVHLDGQITRVRTQVYQHRRAARSTCAPADYDSLYPGDAGFSCTVWAEPDLACVYIGPSAAAGRHRRLNSVDARSSLKPGESATVRLTRRSVRDINGWLRFQADLEWRKTRVAPVFTVEFADPADPAEAALTTPQAEYLITRGPDTTSRPGAVLQEDEYILDPGAAAEADPEGPLDPALAALTDADIARLTAEYEAWRKEKNARLAKVWKAQEKKHREIFGH